MWALQIYLNYSKMNPIMSNDYKFELFRQNPTNLMGSASSNLTKGLKKQVLSCKISFYSRSIRRNYIKLSITNSKIKQKKWWA